MKLLFENLGVRWDSNSQSGSPLGNVWVHSLIPSIFVFWIIFKNHKNHNLVYLTWLSVIIFRKKLQIYELRFLAYKKYNVKSITW